MRTRSSRGVTLPELMLTISIIGVLTVMGNSLFIQITRFFRLNQARIDIQRDARAAFNVIGRNLRQAYASSVVIDNATGQPPYSRISFQKVTGQSITFYQDGTNLKMVFPLPSGVSYDTMTVSRNLLYVAFSHPRVSSVTGEDALISISLTMQAATYQGGTKALQLSVQQIRIMN